MGNYAADQDWLMRDLEDREKMIQSADIERAISSINRLGRRYIVGRMRKAQPELKKTRENILFRRWKNGFRAQRPGAVKILRDAHHTLSLINEVVDF